jgi:hypothetical protein
MKFTKSQLASLAPHVEAGFVARVGAYLGERHPALLAGIDGDEITAEVQAAIERGRGHGLTWESSLAWFTVLTFALGRGFDEHPAVRLALEPDEDDEEDETTRIQALSEAVSAVDWQEA